MRLAVAVFYVIAAFFLIWLTLHSELDEEHKSHRGAGKLPPMSKGK